MTIKAILFVGIAALFLAGCASEARRAQLDNGAVFTANGDALIFHSYRDGEGEIVELTLGSGERRQITSAGARDDRWPSVSADGDTIVFISMRNPPWQVYKVNRDGSGLVQLTTGDRAHIGAAISPDGAHIAYARQTDGGPPEIRLMAVDGSGDRALSPSGVWPSWAPRGDRIFYGKLIAGGGLALASFDLKSGQEILLTDPSLGAAGAGVTPDGRHLYVSARSGTGLTLQRVNLTSGEISDLGIATNVDSSPRVSPDGMSVVFGYGDGDSDGDVFLMDIDTGDVRKLTLDY